MPFYGKGIVFVHIPKTGGSSINVYFEKKLGLNHKDTYFGKGRQHLPYRALAKKFPRRCAKAGMVLAAVRDPYRRAVSSAVYGGRVDVAKCTPARLHAAVKAAIDAGDIPPQVGMLVDAAGRFPANLKLVRTETLAADMRALGFADFDRHAKRTDSHRVLEHLAPKTRKLIAKVYADDFRLLGYPVAVTPPEPDPGSAPPAPPPDAAATAAAAAPTTPRGVPPAPAGEPPAPAGGPSA